MKKFWQLYLVQQRQQSRFSTKKWANYLSWPLSLLIFAPLFWLLTNFYKALALVDPQLGLQLGLLVTLLGAFVFGIPYVMGSLFQAQDLGRLIPLPLQPATIVGAKLASAYFNELVTIGLFFGPALVGYAATGLATPSFWVWSAVVSLLLPLLPLGAAAIVAMLISLLARRAKNQEMAQLFGGLIGLLFPLIYFAAPDGFFSADQMAQNAALTGFADSFVPVKWGAAALTGDLVAFTLFALSSELVLGLVIWLGQLFYLRSVQALGANAAPARVLSAAGFGAALSRQQRPVVAMFWREWRLFFRQPTYILLTFLPALSMAVFALVPLFSRGGFTDLLAQARAPEFAPAVWLGATGLIQLTLAMNSASPTAISREGRFFWLAKSLPIAPKVQVQGKLLQLLALVSVYLLVPSGMVFWLIRPPILHGVAFVLVNLLGALIVVLLGLLIDLWRPKLNWLNPQQAMNNNFNGLFAGVAYFAVLGLFGVGVYLAWGLPLPGIVAGLAVALLLLAAGLYWLIMRVAEAAYRRIVI